jgi:serine/threonine protein kinase
MIKDGYIIEREIGQGGMATVYLARHRVLDRRVAIKVLKKSWLEDADIRRRFLFEAKVLSEMDHPNVVKVSDVIDADGEVSFVMDYVEGKTLKETIERSGGMSEAELKDVFSQVLDAVNYIHGKGYVHRDIKPSNFIVAFSGVVVLLDFGIMKNLGLSSIDHIATRTIDQMGSPIYMSPEHIKSFKDTDERSDVYSLGVLLWQMVTGHVPYGIREESIYEVQTKVLNEPLESTGTKLDSVISRATRKDVASRYSGVVEFKQDFDSLWIQVEDDPVDSGISVSDQTVIVQESYPSVHDHSAAMQRFKSLSGNRKIWSGQRLLLVFSVLALFSMAAYIWHRNSEIRVANTQVVFDFEGILDDSSEAVLSDRIHQIHSSTGLQTAIVTQHDSVIRRFGDIKKYAVCFGKSHGVGDSDLDNGIVYVVCKSARQVFVATGYGIESIYTNDEVKRVVNETLNPHFQSSRLAYGLEAAMNRMTGELTPRLDKIVKGYGTRIQEDCGVSYEAGVENMPSFQGGRSVFIDFVNREYGILNRQNGNKGRYGGIRVSFHVDEQGFVTDVKSLPCLNSASGGCLNDDPVSKDILVDAVEKSPRWMPGKSAGKPVPGSVVEEFILTPTER